MGSEAVSSQPPNNSVATNSKDQLQQTPNDNSESPTLAQPTKVVDSIEQPHQSSTKADHGIVESTVPPDVEKNPVVQSVQTPENLVKPETSAAKIRRNNESALALNSFWVFLGICVMLAGTLIVHSFLLPKIYTCPDGATCNHNLDPRGSIIPHLQTLMQYWLQGGVAIAGMGLTKLISYNSRFVLKKNECTLGSVETNLRAVGGSWTDAILQLTFLQKAMSAFHSWLKGLGLLRDSQVPPVQHGTSWLGILVLLQIGIGFFISLIIGWSITDLQGITSVHVPFKYHDSFSLPPADRRFFTNEELIIADRLNAWFRPPSTSLIPTTVFDGTLVLRDNRTLQATDPRPTGARITGDIQSCGQHGWNVSLLSTNSPYLKDGHGGNLDGVNAYNFSSAHQWYVSYSSTALASKFISNRVVQDSVTIRQYFWASNTSSVIPNATASDDGGVYYAVCNHTAQMVDLPSVNGPGVQGILPSQPIIHSNPANPNVRPCPSDNPLTCVAWSVDEVVLAWYQNNALLRDLIPFSCLNGLLAAFNDVSDVSECGLTGERWAKTLTTSLDALIMTVPVSGNATQYLWANTSAINIDRWWIQVVLPATTFILYLLCIAYTLRLSGWAKDELKEIDLPQILYQNTLEPDTDDIRNTKIVID